MIYEQKMTETITMYGQRKLVPTADLIPRTSVYFVDVRDGRVLLLENKQCDKLGLSGGAVNPGEVLPDALIRESSEEIGTNSIEMGDLIGVAQNFFYYDVTGEAFQAYMMFYAGRVNDPSAIIDGGDIAEGNPDWYEITELKESDFGELAFGSFLKIIKKAENFSSLPG